MEYVVLFRSQCGSSNIFFSPDAPCKAIQGAVQPHEVVPEALADTM